MSAGELKKVTQFIPIDELIDKTSKEYEKLNLKYMRHDPVEIIHEYPLIMKTPVVRTGKKSYLGFDQDVMTKIAEEEKK